MIDELQRYLIVFTTAILIGFSFFTAPLRSMALIIVFQKVIDIFWFIQFNLGGFILSTQRLVYAAVPIVGIGILISESNKKKIPMNLPPLKILLFFFLLHFFINVLRSQTEIQDGIEKLLKVMASYTMLGMGWYYLDSEEKYDYFSNLYIFTYLIVFAGIILQLTGIFKMEYIGVAQQTASQTGGEAVIGGESTARYAGFYSDSGTAVMYLLTAFPLCLHFIYRNDPKKWLYQVLFVILVFSLIFSFNRGMWLTSGVIVFSWFLINREYLKIISSIAIGLFLIVAETFFGQFFLAFFGDVFRSIESGKLVGISGKAIRMEIIQDKFSELDFLEKLFGSGYGGNFLAIASVTGNEKDSSETDFYAFLYDFGILGWLLYYIIPVVALFLVWRNIRQCNPEVYGKALNLKYKVSFAMLCGAFFAFFQSGSKWVSFTFPLYFLLGFALKPPEFFALRRIESENTIQINPRLTA